MDYPVARARGAGATGLRVLQQQRVEPGRPRRPRRAGRDEREGVAAAPRSRARARVVVEILSIVHGGDVREGVFADPVRERGHRLVEWRPASRTAPPRPPEDYGAVLVFGGAMHADQEEAHPWLREEHDIIRGLIDARTPVLGVCLGAQLLAKAAGARVGPLDEPEIGWFPFESTPA